MQMQQIQTPSGPKLIAVPVNAGAAGVQAPMASPSEDQNKMEANKKSNAKKKAAAASKADKSGLDLGELMKDVGLDDLDGYNTENNVTEAVNGLQSIITTQGQAIMTAPLTLATSAGNQIVAQIPQQIQVQVITVVHCM